VSLIPRLMPLVLSLVLGFVAACSSTEEEQVVVDPNSPDISRRIEGPVPDARAAEPSLLDPNRVVARVNDQIITVRSLNARYGAALRQLGEAGDEQVRQILDRFTIDFISQVLVLEAAKRLSVTVTPEDIEKQIAKIEKKLKDERDTTLDEDLEAQGLSRWEFEDQIERDLITERLRAMLLGQRSPVSPETRAIVDIWVRPVEIQDYYDRHREEFRIQEQAEVDAIYIRHSAFRESAVGGRGVRELARKAAEDTVSAARAGEDFEALMKKFHEEPVDMFARPFPRGVQQAPVEEFVWSPETEVGQVSAPIEFPSGFLIVKLSGRREEGLVPFEEVREGIERFLQNIRILLARLNVQTELLRESVVVPRRFKNVLERQYAQLIRQQLEALAQ